MSLEELSRLIFFNTSVHRIAKQVQWERLCDSQGSACRPGRPVMTMLGVSWLFGEELVPGGAASFLNEANEILNL